MWYAQSIHISQQKKCDKAITEISKYSMTAAAIITANNGVPYRSVVNGPGAGLTTVGF